MDDRLDNAAEERLDAEDRVETLRSTRPAAYELARVLSLAARVERSLLRRARMLLPATDASAEADVWSSQVVASQTPQGLVFEPRAADLLRRRLAADPVLLDRAWRLIAWEHRDAPWPIRAEEAINRLTLGSADDHDRAEQVMIASAQRMVESADQPAAGAWVMRALMRLQPALGGSPVARAIQAGVGAQVDGRLDLTGDLPTDTVENWLPWLIPETMERSKVGVSFGDGFVDLDATAGNGAATIDVPTTSPLVLDLFWHDGVSSRSNRLLLEPGQKTRVTVTSTEVEIRTIDGTRRMVRRAGTRASGNGPDFSAIRARHRPFLARESEIRELEALIREFQVVAITGREGIGKTALLCKYIELLETHGTVISHFLQDGPQSWAQPQTVEASLVAQLRDQGQGSAPEEHTAFVEQLRWYAGDRPVFLMLDGVAASDPDNPVAQWIGAGLPSSVRLFYTSEQAIGPPADEHVIDLEERTESNDRLCVAYLEEHWVALADRGVLDRKEPLPKVLFTFALEDQALAIEIRSVLIRSGADVFSVTETAGGKAWERETLRAISEADACIVLATPAAAASKVIGFEIEQMLTRGKRILPIVTGDASVLGRESLLPLVTINALVIPAQGDLDRALLKQVRAFLGLHSGDDLLLERASGVIGVVVRMVHWIAARPEGPLSLNQMPPTLYGGFEAAWSAVTDDRSLPARQVLGMLAVARDEVYVGWLARALRVQEPAVAAVIEQLVGRGFVVTGINRREVEGEAGNITGVLASPSVVLSDESLRMPVLDYLDAAEIRRYNTALAEHPDRGYRLRHRIRHLVDAGDLRGARATVTDLDWLTGICEATGVDDLEAQVALVSSAAGGRSEPTFSAAQ